MDEGLKRAHHKELRQRFPVQNWLQVRRGPKEERSREADFGIEMKIVLAAVICTARSCVCVVVLEVSMCWFVHVSA